MKEKARTEWVSDGHLFGWWRITFFGRGEGRKETKVWSMTANANEILDRSDVAIATTT